MKIRENKLLKAFTAFSNAKSAYEALEQDKNNAGLVADMRRAGQDLDVIGGFDAMTAALNSLYPDDDTRTEQAGIILNQVWDGIGSWHR